MKALPSFPSAISSAMRLAGVVAMVGLLGQTAQARCGYIDDHGNEANAASATPLSTSVVSGDIENIKDRDLFRVVVAPGGSYSFTVTPRAIALGGMPHLEASLVAGDATTILQRKSSTSLSGAVTFTFTPVAGGPLYIDVRSFAEFYEGSYTVQMTSPHGVDSDGDGMPDSWEIANGLNPNVNDANLDPDGDCISNYDEFILGLNPGGGGSSGPSNPGYSPLKLTDHVKIAPSGTVQWNTKRYATYKIRWTNIASPGNIVSQGDTPALPSTWNYLMTYTHTTTSPSHFITDTDATVDDYKIYAVEAITR